MYIRVLLSETILIQILLQVLFSFVSCCIFMQWVCVFAGDANQRIANLESFQQNTESRSGQVESRMDNIENRMEDFQGTCTCT